MDRSQTGRAVIRLYQHARELPPEQAVRIGAAIKAGRLMDFAVRIQRRGSELSHEQIVAFAAFVGLDESDLRLVALPTLKVAGILDFSITDGAMAIDEYVGVAAPLLHQVAATWESLGPTSVERCAIESVDLATAAPLRESDHHAALEAMGFRAEIRAEALLALRAVGIVQRVQPAGSDEPILYNEYVWGSGVVPIARFLASLPTAERETLTALSGDAIAHPGLSLSQASTVNPPVIAAARKVGFLDAARVITRTGTETLFGFSPTLERGLPPTSTDVLHERKLFVAHILFGHRHARVGVGRIRDPLVLVNALLRNGEVGPASSISSDYPLLESHGIVKVRPSMINGRAHLILVKEDVVKDSRDLLKAALGGDGQGGSEQSIDSLWLPGSFQGPETDRRRIRPPADAEADLFRGLIGRLRDHAQRVVRGEAQ